MSHCVYYVWFWHGAPANNNKTHRIAQRYIMYSLMYERSEQNIKLYIIYIMRLLNILFWRISGTLPNHHRIPNNYLFFNGASPGIIFSTPDTKKHAFRAFFIFTALKPYQLFFATRPVPQKTALLGGFSIFLTKRLCLLTI